MKCIAPKLIWPHRSVEWQDTHDEYPVNVPCGKCLACLSNKRSEWAFRLEQEFKYSKSAMFVTLTYDQKHVASNGSLCKKHLQDYLKRLRKSYGKISNNSIRYYAVGEYGSISGRPHYHLLLFNTDQREARVAWHDGKQKPIGLVHIGEVTGASIAYVLKYLVQPSQEMEEKSLEKPFAVMSRAYGIGARYLSDAMVEWHRADDRVYCIREGAKIRLPKFYKTKIWYSEKDKERVSKATLLKSLEQSEMEIQFYKDHFGDRWAETMIEFRDAVISRIKLKVAYTQHL